jgi:hypothetical protein
LTFLAQIASIVLGVASLAWAFDSQGLSAPARWLMIFGLGWLLAAWRRWTWFAPLGLFVLVAAGALGGLFAWDLSDFARRLRGAAPDDDRGGLERRHLTRITLVALAGLGMASVAMAVRLQFTFEWALLLAVVTALGLLQLVNWLRRSRD